MQRAGVAIVALSPHPPIVVPEVGGDQVSRCQSTFEALRQFGRAIADAQVETVIVISPHGPVFRDATAISFLEPLEGDLGSFGASSVRFSVPNDLDLGEEIAQNAGHSGIEVVRVDNTGARRYGATRLDHGVMVPLYFLEQAGFRGRLVSITMGMLPFEELYILGSLISKSVRDVGRRAAVVASGDLSHRLLPNAPAGYSPKGRKFDVALVEKLKEVDVEGIISLDQDLIEEAGECGLRPIIIMLGALDGLSVEPQILSYEGPFGVGYAVALFKPGRETSERLIGEKLVESRKRGIEERRSHESSLVKLARLALETYVREGRTIAPPQPLPEEMVIRAGAFVSIKKHGQLRGCIGTTGPTRENLAEEIIHNALSAGLNDPRFAEVTQDELDDLVYSVDVLSPYEKVDNLEELDPKVYGVIVKKGTRSGLLLPDLEGVDTVRKQLSIAKQKAGIDPRDEDVEVYRFTVKRYT